MRATLTDKTVAAAKPGSELWDMACPTLGLRVGKNRKTWVVKKGNARQAIGHYPSVSLQEARRRVSEPKTTQITFNTLLDDFRRLYLPTIAPSTAKEWNRLLTKHCTFKDIPTTREVYAVLETLAPSEANHTVVPLKRMFRWGKQTGRIETYPDISKPHKEKSRSRVLTLEEIKALWESTSTPTTFNYILRLLILTGQRKGEIANIQLCQIKSTTLSAPCHLSQPSQSPRLSEASSNSAASTYSTLSSNTITWPTTKNGTKHTIPLPLFSSFLVKLLTTSARTLHGSYNAWSQPKARLDQRSGVKDWCLHDIRRSVATHMSKELKVDYLTIEAILNHKPQGVRGIYNRDDRMDEMRDALTRWEQFVMKLPSAD